MNEDDVLYVILLNFTSLKAKRYIILSVLALLLAAGNLLRAQTTSAEEFGINRVQYKDFDWTFYKTNTYSVYYYLGGQELGKFVVMDAASQIEDVEKSLEYRLQDQVDILVYNNLGDLKQSNIGRTMDFVNTGGITKIIGNKIFIYFDGNHQHLREQLREGIAGLCIKNMMFTGSIQDVLQNAVLLNLPSWYSDGLSSYVGESWNAELDAALRDPILTGRFKNMNKISTEEAILAGHSFWHYIALTYGKPTIPNILYLTRINHNIESGFAYVIGKSFQQVMQDWYAFYLDYYKKNTPPGFLDGKDNIIPLKTKKNKFYNHFAINTTATKAAYVVNDLGLYKVKIVDLEKNKTKKVMRGGYRDITMPEDISFPLLAWDPTGTTLAGIYEKRAKTYLFTYDTEKKKKQVKLILNFQKITGVCYGDGPNQLVFSAINRGQSDIYTYNIASSKVVQITNDFWDDLSPQYVKLYNRQGILFCSNRPDDTIRTMRQIDTLLPVKPLDLYFYNTKTNSKSLVRVTNTPFFNESSPIAYNNIYFGYLSERNRVNNRNIAYIDSVFHHYDYYYYFPDSTVVNPKYSIDSLKTVGKWQPDSVRQIAVFKDVAHSFAATSNNVGMMEQVVAYRKGEIIEQYMHKGKPVFYINKISKEVEPSKEIDFKFNTPYNDSDKPAPKPDTTTIKKDTATKKPEGNNVDINNYVFQSEFTLKPDTAKPANNTPQKSIDQKDDNAAKKFRASPFRFSRALPYTVKFYNDFFATQIDNSLLINRYESYTGTGGVYQNPDLGALLKFGINDLFEDYRIVGGFRIPTNISGTEYFITFEDFKKRLDKKFTFYREVHSDNYDFTPYWFQTVPGKSKTNYAEASFRYPLDVNRSLRVNFFYRQQKIVFQAEDTFSLGLPNYTENWGGIHAEYVFDNTRKIQLNILNGTRYKVYTDVQKLLDQKNFFTYVLGLDFRHYERIHRQIIWATRLNVTTSWGDAKVAYLLGGVDNWLFAKQVQTDPNSTDQTAYAFQALSANLRGFYEGARKGNSAALVNTEIRFPVFAYFSNAPVRSDFIKNFQVIGFYDAGTAWLGVSPYSQDNPFNTKVFDRSPVEVKVNYFREPVIMGFGLGVRTTLFGYFIRVDYARGLDSGEILKPVWYLSIGTDF